MSQTTQLASLKEAYYRGVMKVREKDTWVEYASMKDMRIAISDLENEIKSSKPSGTHKAIVRRMF